MSPLVQETSFHGPEPTAVVVPKPSAPLFESQMIEEKLSARKGTSATKGVFRSSLIVSGSTTVALAIGPQLAWVTLGFAASKARSIVYLTSLASSARAVVALGAVVKLEGVFGPRVVRRSRTAPGSAPAARPCRLPEACRRSGSRPGARGCSSPDADRACRYRRSAPRRCPSPRPRRRGQATR